MSRKPRVEAPIPLPENRNHAIAQIELAFAACPRPSQEELVSEWGIDGPAVIENWGTRDRASVARLNCFDTEDLSYMSSKGLRYFLPAIFVAFLRRPEVVGFDDFAGIVSRLEGIAGLRRPICIPGLPEYDDGPFYCPIVLTSEQRLAVREFCGQLLTIIRKFHLGSYEKEYQERLKQLRKSIVTYSCDADYDEEPRSDALGARMHPASHP